MGLRDTVLCWCIYVHVCVCIKAQHLKNFSGDLEIIHLPLLWDIVKLQQAFSPYVVTLIIATGILCSQTNMKPDFTYGCVLAVPPSNHPHL